MTVRHIVLFRFVEDVTEEQVTAVEAGLAQLPGLIPEIRSYRYGRDLGLDPVNPGFGLVADFDSAGAFASYRDHPDHQAFIARCIVPAVAERISMQMEV